MPKTGSHLKIRSFGTDVLGVRLEGNPSKPEPIYFRVAFPGGDVDIARCSDDTYWIHVRVNRPEDLTGQGFGEVGKLTDARIDIKGKHASECNAGDFADPDLYHLAVRVARA